MNTSQSENVEMTLTENISNIAKQVDTRQFAKILYPLEEIIFIVIFGNIVCGENVYDFLTHASYNLAFLREYYPYENGIPSKNTVYRALQLIKPEYMEFLLQCMKRDLNPYHIAFDGQCQKGSKRCTGLSVGRYIVSALDISNGISFMQAMVDEKSNEIPIVASLLKQIDLNNKIITVDSLNTQVKNTKTIIEGHGNYLFPLKLNHGLLYEAIEYFFVTQNASHHIKNRKDPNEYCKIMEIRSSKLETKECFVADIDELTDIKEQIKKDGWVGVKQIVMIVHHSSDPLKSDEIRFFIASVKQSAEEHVNLVREHWKIETMHQYLDVVFKEDACMVSNTNAVQNLNIIRKTVLSLMLKYKNKYDMNCSIKRLRSMFTYDKEMRKQLIDLY